MKVLYAGSFHPPTLGHIDILRRAAQLFDEVEVAVMMNPAKTYQISPEARVDMLRRCLAGCPNIRVFADSGLVADVARRNGADALLRGLRNAADYDYEAPMAEANRQLGAPETIYITSRSQYAHISSTIVGDIARHGGDLRPFVPQEILKEIRSYYIVQE